MDSSRSSADMKIPFHTKLGSSYHAIHSSIGGNGRADYTKEGRKWRHEKKTRVNETNKKKEENGATRKKTRVNKPKQKKRENREQKQEHEHKRTKKREVKKTEQKQKQPEPPGESKNKKENQAGTYCSATERSMSHDAYSLGCN